MDARFERNVPALSEAECELLRTKRAAVIGCGGLGGYLIEMLVRLGIGTVVAVDGDVFEVSNLNRQLLSSPALLGRKKAEAAADRVQMINPDVQVIPVCRFLDRENAVEILRGCDVVLDGLDSIEARYILADACEELGIPYIFGAIQGWVAQAAICLPGDGLIRNLYPEDVAVTDHSVLSFTPAVCAGMQISLCTKLLTNRAVENGKLWFVDLMHQEQELIPMI